MNPHREGRDQPELPKTSWWLPVRTPPPWMQFVWASTILIGIFGGWAFGTRPVSCAEPEPSSACTESVLQFAARPGPDVEMVCKPGQRLELLKDRAMVVCHCDHANDPSPSEIMEWRVRMASVNGLMKDTRARLEKLEERMPKEEDEAFLWGNMGNIDQRVKKLEEKKP